MLFFNQALKRERHARADRIQDLNLAMNGGEEAKRLVRQLRNQ